MSNRRIEVQSRKRSSVQRLSNNDPSLRFFFYIKESASYSSLSRSSSVLKSFNSLCPTDNSWNLGHFYPLDYGSDGFWKGCLLHVGTTMTTKKLELRVSKFISEHLEAGNLTDAILQEFVQDQCDTSESESIDSDDESSAPTPKRQKLDSGKNIQSHSQELPNVTAIVPMDQATPHMLISTRPTNKTTPNVTSTFKSTTTSTTERITAELLKMKRFQSNERQVIDSTDIDGTTEDQQQEDPANVPRPRNGEITLERIYSKLCKLDAYVRSEFRKLKRNSNEASFQRLDPGPGDEFIDPDGNSFTLSSFTKSNPSSFIRQFAVKRFGMPYLMNHVVDPGKISTRESASKEVVKELKDALFKVFQPSSVNAGEAMWNSARKSLNQLFAEQKHAMKQRGNSSSTI